MQPRLPTMAALVAFTLWAPSGAGAQSAPAVPAVSRPAETKWVVDMVHSQVAFGVRHLVGQVRGTFGQWYAVITTGDGAQIASNSESVTQSQVATQRMAPGFELIAEAVAKNLERLSRDPSATRRA